MIKNRRSTYTKVVHKMFPEKIWEIVDKWDFSSTLNKIARECFVYGNNKLNTKELECVKQWCTELDRTGVISFELDPVLSEGDDVIVDFGSKNKPKSGIIVLQDNGELLNERGDYKIDFCNGFVGWYSIDRISEMK